MNSILLPGMSDMLDMSLAVLAVVVPLGLVYFMVEYAPALLQEPVCKEEARWPDNLPGSQAEKDEK